MRAAAPALSAALLLASCGGGQGELDVVGIAPARSGATASRPDALLYDVEVRAGQLRSLLDQGGLVDLQIVDCSAPDAGADIVPITFGGTPLESLSSDQVADNPGMDVLLTAEMPRRVAALPNRCARFAGRSGFEVASKPVPLPRP